MLKSRLLTIALTINIFYLIVCVVFGEFRFGAVDDYYMAAVLTGAHGGGFNPHMYFVNALYGYALYPLYMILPKISWYYVGEIASVFISFTTISYVILKKLGCTWGALLSVLLVSFFAPDFYLNAQFTQCASVLSAAGMLAVVYAISENRNSRWFVWGGFLLLWGSIMRWDAFLMGMPFFAVSVLFCFRECIQQRRRIVVASLIVLASVFGTKTFNDKLFNNDTYSWYAEFQKPRSLIGDSGFYDGDAVLDDLEEAGNQGTDFRYARSWLFYDKKALAPDSLYFYANAIKNYKAEIDYIGILRELFLSLCSFVEAPLFWLWTFFSLSIFLTNRSRSALPWAFFVLFCLMALYLLSINRFVHRVEAGLWMYASVLSVPFWGRFSAPPKKLLRVAVVLCILVNVSFLVAFDNKNSGSQLPKYKAEDVRGFIEYTTARPDTLFLLPLDSYKALSQRHLPWVADSAGVLQNIIPLGYWTTYLPQIEDNLARHGIGNPMGELDNPKVFVVDLQFLSDYMKRHHNKDVESVLVQRFGAMKVFKYKLNVQGDVE